MAVRKCFAVHDAKAGAFLPPFFVLTRGVAFRSFEAAVLNSDHEFARFAEDYRLYELGEWEDLDAKFVLHDPPIEIAWAASIKAARTQEGN